MLEEELLEGLRRRNFPKEVVEEQGKRFARATRFITEENKKKSNKVNEVEKASVSGGSDGSAGDSDEGELELSEEDGRRWAGKAKLESIEDEVHGMPSAEEILVESDRTVTLHAEVARHFSAKNDELRKGQKLL